MAWRACDSVCVARYIHMGIDTGVATRLAEYLRDPRRAITEEGVVCLMCGRCFRHLTNTHLRLHGLTSDAYKQRFGYNSRRALMVAEVRQTHAVNANRLGLADRIRSRPIFENIELRRQGGRHPHALEELLTRRERSHARTPLSLGTGAGASPQRGRSGAERTWQPAPMAAWPDEALLKRRTHP